MLPEEVEPVLSTENLQLFLLEMFLSIPMNSLCRTSSDHVVMLNKLELLWEKTEGQEASLMLSLRLMKWPRKQ